MKPTDSFFLDRMREEGNTNICIIDTMIFFILYLYFEIAPPARKGFCDTVYEEGGLGIDSPPPSTVTGKKWNSALQKDRSP